MNRLFCGEALDVMEKMLTQTNAEEVKVVEAELRDGQLTDAGKETLLYILRCVELAQEAGQVQQLTLF